MEKNEHVYVFANEQNERKGNSRKKEREKSVDQREKRIIGIEVDCIWFDDFSLSHSLFQLFAASLLLFPLQLQH